MVSVTVLVNDVDYTDYFSDLKINSSVTQYTKSYAVKLYDPSQNLTGKFQYGDDIKIKFNGTLKFRGRVENVTETQFYVNLSGRDYTARFLDRRVYKSYNNREISDIITNSSDGLVPTYTPDITTSNVQTTNTYITREWKGVSLLKVMHELAEIAKYDFHVDEYKDLNFFPRETLDSGLTLSSTTNILTYDAPKLGKDVVTRLTFYGKEGICVQVEDLQAQQTWGIREDTVVDPTVDNEDLAYERAMAILRRKANPIQRVTCVTLIDDVGNLAPGQLVKIKIPERNIDSQFVVLEMEFNVPPGTCRIKTAEYSVELQDILADLTKKVVDIDLRDADLQATPVRYNRFQDEKVMEVVVRIYRKYVSEGFILGHPAFSAFGNKLGYSTGTEELIWSNE